MTIIDRYIIKQFIFTQIFSVMALSVIFIVVNMMESLDSFIDQKANTLVIVKYYAYYLPEILKLLFPISTLLASLFAIGRLSNLNEITAMKSGGLSLYRMMLPILIYSIFLSFGQLYFSGWIVPIANQKKIEIEQFYLNKIVSGGPIYNLYFRDSPTRNLTMQSYVSDMRRGNRIAIEEFSSDYYQPRLVRRIEAESITWDTTENNWQLINVIERRYDSKVTTTRYDYFTPELNINHHNISKLRRTLSEMNLDDLRDYIELMRRGGADVRKEMIEYYAHYSFPFSNLIVVLFGVPFASVRKKGGIAVQIGVAMSISFIYMIFTKVGQTIGFSMNINPIVTAWMANIIFSFVALVNIIKTKT